MSNWQKNFQRPGNSGFPQILRLCSCSLTIYIYLYNLWLRHTMTCYTLREHRELLVPQTVFLPQNGNMRSKLWITVFLLLQYVLTLCVPDLFCNLCLNGSFIILFLFYKATLFWSYCFIMFIFFHLPTMFCSYCLIYQVSYISIFGCFLTIYFYIIDWFPVNAYMYVCSDLPTLVLIY